MINKPKGTRDFFGSDAFKFEYLYSVLKNYSNKYGFTKIIFPTFEQKELFVRSTGEESDIVQKEIYEFKDKSNRVLALRPEGTASTIRLVLENRLIHRNENQKYYYFAPMYRYERPQQGRQREFYQYGVEVFNDDSIFTELELLSFLSSFFSRVKIKHILKINTLGNKESRGMYINALRDYLIPFEKELSEDSQRRLHSNVLRILDSKSHRDQEILEEAPVLWDFLSNKEKLRFETLLDLLDKNNIRYEIDQKLVRGLDYYNDLVFEFVSYETKLTLAGGGRYDTLIQQFNSKLAVNSIGFAMGIERILEHFDFQNKLKDNYFYLGTTNKENDEQLFIVASKLRVKGYNLKVNYVNTKYSSLEASAIKENFLTMLILEDNNVLKMIELSSGKTHEISINKF